MRALYGRSLMLTLGGRNPPRAHRLSAQRLSRAIEYLSATETPILKCMAGHAALTPFHFLRCFKRTTGLTPHEWVTLLRLDRARRLLLRGESVASVAAAVGYTNVGWFRRLFKKHYGRLPSLLDRNQW